MIRFHSRTYMPERLIEHGRQRGSRLVGALAIMVGCTGAATGQLCPASLYSLQWENPRPVSIQVGSDSAPLPIYFGPNHAGLPSICPRRVPVITSTWFVDDPSVALVGQCASATECAVFGQGVGETKLHVSAISISDLVSGDLLGSNQKDIYVTEQPQQPPDGCTDQEGNPVLCGGGCVTSSGMAAASAVIGLPSQSGRVARLAAASSSPPVIAGSCDPHGDPVQTVTSLDPNDKVGPTGVGPSRFIPGQPAAAYSVYFDNDPTATAPTQSATVTDALSANLDLATLVLGAITLPNQVVTPPSVPLSLAPFITTVDLRPTTNLLVNIDVYLNRSTGVVAWTLESLDPATNQPPTDPMAGFLTPGAEGSVSFTVRPKPALATGTVIQNTAAVVFDANPVINTPTWSNTIDNTKPTSHVSPLAVSQTSTNFAISWAGSDVGAGVRDFSVYASDNGGAFTVWQTNTTATSGTFAGTVGHTYGFYSIARDLVGNVENSKAVAEATTAITAPPTIQCTGCYFVINGVRATFAFNVGVVGPGSTFTYNYRTSAQAVQFVSTTTSQISVNGKTTTFSGQGKLNGQTGYNFSVTATDGGGVGSGLDSFSITITGPTNYSYVVSGAVVGGDIVVKQ